MRHEPLPEGIEESLPNQARRLEAYRRTLLDCFEHWGYRLVAPPLVEFHDTLVADSESLERQTFRLTDTLSDSVLGVRADITPQIARIDRQNIAQDQVARLCYVGSVLRAHPEVLGGTRNPIQAGAELYGCDDASGDAEIVALLCAALQAVQCESWCLGLGHAGIFRALAEQADWDQSDCEQLFGLLQRKAKPDISEWLAEHPADKEIMTAIEKLPDLSGPDEEVLQRGERALACIGEQAASALQILRTVAQRVRAEYPQVQLHFDLGEASGFHYESGLVFAAYRAGQGQEIARGGRYDAQNRRPAVGFSLSLRTLTQCGDLDVAEPKKIFAPWGEDSVRDAAIIELRASGRVVISALDPNDTAQAQGCAEQLVSENDQWVVQAIDE